MWQWLVDQGTSVTAPAGPDACQPIHSACDGDRLTLVCLPPSFPGDALLDGFRPPSTVCRGPAHERRAVSSNATPNCACL